MNNQGLSVHLKCVHSSSRVNNETLLSQSTIVVREEPIDPVLVETGSVLSEVVGKVVGNDGKAGAAKQQGGKKCHWYSPTFKAEEVINMMEQPSKTQESVVEHFRTDQSYVSRYLKNKTQIMKDTAGDCGKKFFKG